MVVILAVSLKHLLDLARYDIFVVASTQFSQLVFQISVTLDGESVIGESFLCFVRPSEPSLFELVSTKTDLSVAAGASMR